MLEHNLGLLMRSQNVTHFNGALTTKNPPQDSNNISSISNNIPLKWIEVLVDGDAVVCRQKEKRESETWRNDR